MRLFRCQVCDNIIYFENRTCGRCGHRLGYAPELGQMTALEPAGDDQWTPLAGDRAPRRFCGNAESRRLQLAGPRLARTATIAPPAGTTTRSPTLPTGQLVAWRKIERAKHRLFYSLLRWACR